MVGWLDGWMMVEKSVPSGYVKIAIEMAIYSGVSH